MLRFAGLDRPRKHSRRRKKNGGRHPTGSRARSRATAAHHFYWRAQDGPGGFGSSGDAGAIGHASGRSEYLGRVAAVSNPGPARDSMPVRAASALSRVTFEDSADGGRHGGSVAALLSVPVLS